MFFFSFFLSFFLSRYIYKYICTDLLRYEGEVIDMDMDMDTDTERNCLLRVCVSLSICLLL